MSKESVNETMIILAKRGKGKAILSGMKAEKVEELYDAKLKNVEEKTENSSRLEKEDDEMGM